MGFLIGAVREPPLRVDFHPKACGYKNNSSHATRYPFPNYRKLQTLFDP